MQKSKLRKRILKIREIKNNKDIKIKFDFIFELLKKHKNKKRNIGGYYPVNNEIDDLSLLKELEKKKYKILLPIIKNRSRMDFYKWSFEDPLKLNKFGIPEPYKKKICVPDIVLVPLVAFDTKLNRLGYGGGYYDRYFYRIRKKKKILKIGLAFNYQKIKKIPVNRYDQKLDYIVTDNSILK